MGSSKCVTYFDEYWSCVTCRKRLCAVCSLAESHRGHELRLDFDACTRRLARFTANYGLVRSLMTDLRSHLRVRRLGPLPRKASPSPLQVLQKTCSDHLETLSTYELVLRGLSDNFRSSVSEPLRRHFLEVKHLALHVDAGECQLRQALADQALALQTVVTENEARVSDWRTSATHLASFRGNQQ